MNVGDALRDKRVCICGGSGGVGKTTTAAAVAMGMAAEGARVAVVTIDPARRLANALGLETLGNEPRPVDPARFAAAGVEMKGELWAGSTCWSSTRRRRGTPSTSWTRRTG
jgi:NAD(P)-dependent dehydrogenase (short-subunit alcohol dehydrogenase family)